MQLINAKQEIARLFSDAISQYLTSENCSSFSMDECGSSIDTPKDFCHGDLTSNIAMRLSRHVKKNPMDIAESLRGILMSPSEKDKEASVISKAEIVKPGFINLWYKKEFLHDNLFFIREIDEKYGMQSFGNGKKIQLEFVSANPTGPLTIAHGRQAAVGDALCRILSFCGFSAEKEYFINDEGRQINLLGTSILYHYLSFFNSPFDFPDDGYRGEYVKHIAAQIRDKYKDKFVKNYKKHSKFFQDYGVNEILNSIKSDLSDFGITFDSWFSQKKISAKAITETLKLLEKKGLIYKKDGATWFKSTRFKDDKDRVVIKSDGALTYLTPDIAYHKSKYERGFDRVIDIWGPDHHGYIARIKAAVQGLGYDPSAVSVLIVQLAKLYREGKALSMSTRKGEFITLRELMNEVGVDVTKFFLLMRKLDSHLDFDIEIAKKQSQDNPVYYIQYAHARIWSILSFAASKGITINRKPDLNMLDTPEEINLMRQLVVFPYTVMASGSNLEPYFIISYLNLLAKNFHAFYTKHRVVSDDDAKTYARLYMIDCIRICLANGLKLLGVSFPEKM